MTIYVVEQGDTIASIAERFGISAERLISDNGLQDLDNLVIGQALIIVYPEQTYVVQQGDTLAGIADAHGITVIQLLRNNPELSDREFLYPGETLIISFGKKLRDITTNGYAYPFINRDVLRKTLPFLTYLTIFNYRITEEGDLVSIDDTEIIQLAKSYGVAPIMVISATTYQGIDSIDVTYNILNNPSVQDRIINNILTILSSKGYYAANIYIQNVSPQSQKLVENYISNITNRLNSEGYPVFVTLTPISFSGDIFSIDYSRIGQTANHILLLTYEWGYSYGPPASIISTDTAQKILEHLTNQIPPEKIDIGIPIIGYDWQLPYVPGETRANSLSTDAAILLASEVGATIRYDETVQAPYYYYATGGSESPTFHVVWFKDVRRMNVLLNFVPEYGIRGVAIWNIMQYYSQLWLLINSQYNITTVSLDQME